MDGVEPHYQLIIDRVGGLDVLEVQVELSSNLFSDEVKKIEKLEAQIISALFNVLGIRAKVRLVEPKTIMRSEGKAKRVVDKRII